MREEKPKWMRRGVIITLACLVVFLIGCGVLLACLKQDGATSAPLILPDGTRVTVAGVTFGTNHVFGTPLARLAGYTPLLIRGLLFRLLGPNLCNLQTLSTPTPTLVIWMKSPVKSQIISQIIYPDTWRLRLGDTEGFVSGSDLFFNVGFGGLVPLQFTVFPRRESGMTVHFYSYDPSTGKATNCATMGLPNPAFHAYPQWQPETLPAVHRAGDVEATLRHFSTGLGSQSYMSYLKGGGYRMKFGTNRDDGQNESFCQLELRSLADTNQTWRVDHLEISDATGNRLENSINWFNSGENGFGFKTGLWTNESAWKLRCEIKRVKGFAPNELFTFRDVPLGEFHKTNHLGWTTNFNGLTVTLVSFLRQPQPTNNRWSSAQFSKAKFHVSGLTNDLHLDLIETRADNGTNVECVSFSNGGDDQERDFAQMPSDAKTLDLTFAVHRGRWVEFLVKPETGLAHFQYP